MANPLPGVSASCDKILKSNLKGYEKQLNIGHFNACSMNPKNLSGKFDEIRKILSGHQLNIVGISETWLKQYISNKSVSISNYKIYRNDRSNSRGGGVALYISKNIKSKLIAKSLDAIEYLFVEIVLMNTKILVGVVYRPPNSKKTNRNRIVFIYSLQ